MIIEVYLIIVIYNLTIILMSLISAHNITRTFKSGTVVTHVLKDISFEVPEGEFISIIGRSGAGKSTLLYQLSLLDIPTSGEIIIDGIKTSTLHNDHRTEMRLRQFGFVFQDYANIPDLTAIENVMVPLLMHGETKDVAKQQSLTALRRVGMEKRPNNLPSQLSGGEQQRVSIARAIAHTPHILFADEPTANLDNANADIVIDLLKQLNKAGQTIVMITHELNYAQEADRIIELDDGKIIKDYNPHRKTRKQI